MVGEVRVLLHICCAPCSIYPLRILREGGDEVCGLFYNPNIHPSLEYRRRLETVDAYAGQERLVVFRDEGLPLETFLRQVSFREQERCRICYEMRLAHTARVALRQHCDAFTTTLLYSRYQKHDLIRVVGERVAAEIGIPFVYRDFREGWSEGVRISKARGMYRQPYCGCIYSEAERYASRPLRRCG
jgi:hypothetical protein